MKRTKSTIYLLFIALLVALVPVYPDAAGKTKLKKSSISITAGKTYKNKLKNAKGKVTWKSKNKKIATVTSKGAIKAKKAGKTKIIATYKKKKYTCSVKVVAKKPTVTPVVTSTPTQTTPAIMPNVTLAPEETEQPTITKKPASTPEHFVNTPEPTKELYKITSISTAPPIEYGNFAGSPYIEINDNQPFFTENEKTCIEPFELYSALDDLGRCGTAFANVCKEIMPTEERGEIGQIKPSGWQTVKYPDVIPDLYLYNRCHLIGYQLAGENANVKNLITGTRYLNVTGMLPFENMIDDYADSTNNHVLYRVTPVFAEDNLVADGVLMEAWSVEDNGAGACFCVFCYNVQPGIAIDYATGDSRIDESLLTVAPTVTPTATVVPTATPSPTPTQALRTPTPFPTITISPSTAPTPIITASPAATPTPTATVSPTATPTKAPNEEAYYIGHKTNKVFHRPNCASVKRMNANNKVTLFSRADAVSQGYRACNVCSP